MARSDKGNDRKFSIGKFLVRFAIFVCFLILGGMLYIYLTLGSAKSEKISTKDEDLGITKKETKGIRNFVFYGVDAGDDMKGRSDAIMIVTVDTYNNKIKLSSVPRDSYVDIPGHGMDKINHAYVYGGPELAIKTLNLNFNLDVKYFASVNFDTLPKIIDSLGGVQITVTDREATQVKGLTKGGTYLLTGKQALAFSRIRKIDSDFERGRRQRDVIQAIITKLLSANAISYASILTRVMPDVTTNMTTGQILEVAASVVGNNITTIEQTRFPGADLGHGEMINGVYYYVFDIEENKNRVLEYIFYDIKPPEAAN